MKPLLGALVGTFLVLCSLPSQTLAVDFGPAILVSVADQKLALMKDGKVTERFRISSSRFGVGDGVGSYRTPLGTLWVCNKIGDDLPIGAVLKNRRPTGEVLPANAPGRDPIVTRVLWLKGLLGDTQNAYSRRIYIHGTPKERAIGKPASFGCIRMRSRDVVKVFDAVEVGSHVVISNEPLANLIATTRTAGKVAASH